MIIKISSQLAVRVLLLVLSLSGGSMTTAKDLTFSGYNWTIKDTGGGKWGPGPNYFSNDPSNVWVDGKGRLHLRITRRQGNWFCAEVISHRSFGYGQYEWKLAEISPSGELDPHVVLGLFTWSDRPEFAHREIDVEVARWAQYHDPTNSQFVVQPYQPRGHQHRFKTPTVANVTHSFNWQPERVDFMSKWSAAGNEERNYTWEFVNGSSSSAIVPQPFDENARMNLWLINSTAGPLSQQSVEVVLESFTFRSPAELMQTTSPPTSRSLQLTSQHESSMPPSQTAYDNTTSSTANTSPKSDGMSTSPGQSSSTQQKSCKSTLCGQLPATTSSAVKHSSPANLVEMACLILVACLVLIAA